jgi:hypothetical protein
MDYRQILTQTNSSEITVILATHLVYALQSKQ